MDIHVHEDCKFLFNLFTYECSYLNEFKVHMSYHDIPTKILKGGIRMRMCVEGRRGWEEWRLNKVNILMKLLQNLDLDH